MFINIKRVNYIKEITIKYIWVNKKFLIKTLNISLNYHKNTVKTRWINFRQPNWFYFFLPCRTWRSVARDDTLRRTAGSRSALWSFRPTVLRTKTENKIIKKIFKKKVKFYCQHFVLHSNRIFFQYHLDIYSFYVYNL